MKKLLTAAAVTALSTTAAFASPTPITDLNGTGVEALESVFLGEAQRICEEVGSHPYTDENYVAVDIDHAELFFTCYTLDENYEPTGNGMNVVAALTDNIRQPMLHLLYTHRNDQARWDALAAQVATEDAADSSIYNETGGENSYDWSEYNRRDNLIVDKLNKLHWSNCSDKSWAELDDEWNGTDSVEKGHVLFDMSEDDFNELMAAMDEAADCPDNNAGKSEDDNVSYKAPEEVDESDNSAKVTLPAYASDEGDFGGTDGHGSFRAWAQAAWGGSMYTDIRNGAAEVINKGNNRFIVWYESINFGYDWDNGSISVADSTD